MRISNIELALTPITHETRDLRCVLMIDDRASKQSPCPSLRAYADLVPLGNGGMGAVYKARHIESGTPVVIKTVREYDKREQHAALKREISALRRLSHPGIVPVLDDGVTEEGAPFIAMALLEGQTLHDALDQVWTSPDGRTPHLDDTDLMANRDEQPYAAPIKTNASLHERLTWIRKLCAPLAYLHGEGLVHRDLKPQNVVFHGEEPILIDLGIAGHFAGHHGREELDLAPDAGTAAYMAPEQVRRQLVDARADMYALGCILYECVTGRPPFVGTTFTHVARQHEHAEPVPPSQLTRGIEPALDRLILRLLAKDPRDRIGFATDVAAELITLGASNEPERGPRPKPYLYRPPFQGRAQVMDRLLHAIDHLTQQKQSGFCLVYGESGSGKTRLLVELMRSAPLRRGSAQVHTGQCASPQAREDGAPLSVTPPLHPLRSLLQAAAERASQTRSPQTDMWVRILAPYEPSMRELLAATEMIGSESQAAPPEIAKAQIIQAVLDILRTFGERTLVLMLDDVQWADELTLSALEAFAKTKADMRGVLLIAAYRSEAARPEIERLIATNLVEAIDLGRLESWAIHEIVQGMLATSHPPPTVLDALARNAKGNPFFVAQYLHAALERGILRRHAQHGFSFDALGAAQALLSLPVPPSIEEIIAQRMEGLDQDTRAVVTWAAILGSEMDEDLLLANTPKDTDGQALLNRLKTRGILSFTDRGQWRFEHQRLEEIAYQKLDPVERTQLHRRASEVLLHAFSSTRDEARAAQIGVHLDRAGLHAKAGRFFIRAASHAHRVHANRRAIELLDAALNALKRAAKTRGKRARLAWLYEQKGDLLALARDNEAAISAYSAALDECAPVSSLDRARRLRKCGIAHKQAERFPDAFALYDLAEAALGREPQKRALRNEWLRIQMERLFIHYRLGDTQAIAAMWQGIEPHVSSFGTARVRARYFAGRAMYGLRCAQFYASDETLRSMRKSVSAARASRNVYDILASRCDLGIILWLAGKPAEAEACLLTALEGAKQAGYQEIETRSAAYRAVLVRQRGDVSATSTYAQSALYTAERAQMADYVGVAHANLAWVAVRRGDLVAAEEKARAALHVWKRGFPFQWLARLPLAEVRMEKGDLQGAVAEVKAVLAKDQHRLPKRLQNALEKAVSAFEANETANESAALRNALRRERRRSDG